jgi:hypothetical protein
MKPKYSTCSFGVQGTDLIDLKLQVRQWLAALTLGTPKGDDTEDTKFRFTLSNIRPIAVSMNGTVAVWEADVAADIND